MIKINLAPKGQIKSLGGGSAAIDTGTGYLEVSDSDAQRIGIVRLFILLLGPVGLYVWQTQNLPQRVQILNQKQQVYSSLSAKNSKAKSAVDEMKKYKADQSKLLEQFNSIENLQKDRLREVRILDLVQREIPERMWLTKIDLKENNLEISGLVATDSDLTLFMDILSKNIFLKEVNLIKTTEKSVGKVVTKEFSISCVLLKNEQRNMKKIGGEG